MNDLLQAVGYAAIVYLLFNYLVSFGSGRPLVEWINPGRKYLPFLAAALIGGMYGLLRFAVAKYQKGYAELLQKLITEEKAPPEVMGALTFVTIGAAVLMLAAWCWWFLPRAPQTFSPNPRDLVAEYRRALRHYVRWAGGLDFAILCEVRGGKLQVIAEGASDKAILRGLNRLPGVHTAVEGQHAPDIEAQKRIYREFAAELFDRWGQLNEVVAPARHGTNVAINFDLRYGALYAEMIEEGTAPGGTHPVGIFLFAAALNQHEVNTLSAARHFWMLSQAIRHIRTGVAKG
jgi:hypothetical protein